MGTTMASAIFLLFFPFFYFGETTAGDNWERNVIDKPIPQGYIRIGDMIVPEDFFNSTKGATPSWRVKWPNGRVPLRVDSSINHCRRALVQAVEEYHRYTCIRFSPYNGERDYVNMFYGRGCYSMIGWQGGGWQDLSLGQGCCDVGTVIHELGHAIGLIHEHQRSDRDDFINIHWENIEPGRENQFNTVPPGNNYLVTGFDYNSIMLYGELAFSRDGWSPTMTSKSGQRLYEVYNKQGLSRYDIQTINRIYNC